MQTSFLDLFMARWDCSLKLAFVRFCIGYILYLHLHRYFPDRSPWLVTTLIWSWQPVRMTFIPTGFTNLALQQLSVSSLELAPTQVCERFPHTEHILKVIDGQVLLYLYCCKDLSYSRFWCSSSVTLSASSHLVSASVPGKLTPYSFKGPIFLLLKKITRLFLPPPAATIPSLPLPLLVPDLSQQ